MPDPISSHQSAPQAFYDDEQQQCVSPSSPQISGGSEPNPPSVANPKSQGGAPGTTNTSGDGGAPGFDVSDPGSQRLVATYQSKQAKAPSCGESVVTSAATCTLAALSAAEAALAKWGAVKVVANVALCGGAFEQAIKNCSEH